MAIVLNVQGYRRMAQNLCQGGFVRACYRRSVAGSLIGGIKETQEVLDFCDKHGITADVEVIDIKDVNDAFKKVKKRDVSMRYVIDVANTLKLR